MSFVQLHPEDNVLVALEVLKAGKKIRFKGDEFMLKETVPAKHKFTISDLRKGDDVFMYGTLIGKATRDIQKAEQISIHNITNATGNYSEEIKDQKWKGPAPGDWATRTFEGYHRSDGRVGTANYWLVLPLVFCENRNIEVLKSSLGESLGYTTDSNFSLDIDPLLKSFRDGAGKKELLKIPVIRTAEDPGAKRVFRNVDGIKFLKHDGGCGGTKEDSESLGALLAAYITHPNVGGATILSLGCQHLQIQYIRKLINEMDPSCSKPLVFLEQQESAGEEDFLAEALRQTFVGLIQANKAERNPAPLSKLTIGLECGGSDGFSGISANPTLGYVSDMLAVLGGTSILSEFPELNGVEQELIHRCVNRDLAEKFSDLMGRYARKAEDSGSAFAENPSPGNISEGLITNSMKSAGAARKGGTSPVTDVLSYGEQARHPGLNLLCTPGNDVESTTGLAGSGANIILFSTGLGTPTGNPICPVIKVSSNTDLYLRMRDIIDFNTGSMIDKNDTIESLGENLLNYIIEVASGRELPSAVRLAQDDFIPWKRGISL